MSAACLVLKPQFRLYPEADGVVLFNRNPYEAHVRYKLPPAAAFTAALFDGQRTEKDIAGIVSDVFGCPDEEAAERVRGLVEALSDTLLVPSYEIDTKWLHLGRSVQKLETFLYRADELPQMRAAKPYTLVYVMTRHCPRRCLYCYADAAPNSVDSGTRLSMSRLRRIIREASELGVSLFTLSGGEPLVCKETREVMLELLDKGIVPWVSTKALLAEQLASELSRAGLPIIQVSIDSLNPRTQDTLSGCRGTFADLRASLENAIQAGIRVYTNTVLTRMNIEGIPDLVQWLLDIGVSACLLTPYARSLGRHTDRLFATEDSLQELAEWYRDVDQERVQLRFTTALAPGLVSAETKSSGEDRGHARSKCTAGREGLAFTWRGDVVPCERLASARVPEAVVGSLLEQSISDVWNSEKLLSLCLPSREDCEGTACEDCPIFDECRYERGRCLVRSWLAYGTLQGPDPLCEYAPTVELRIM